MDRTQWDTAIDRLIAPVRIVVFRSNADPKGHPRRAAVVFGDKGTREIFVHLEGELAELVARFEAKNKRPTSVTDAPASSPMVQCPPPVGGGVAIADLDDVDVGEAVTLIPEG